MNEMNNTENGLTHGSLIFGILLIISAALVFYPLISSLSDTINTMNEHPGLREALEGTAVKATLGIAGLGLLYTVLGYLLYVSEGFINYTVETDILLEKHLKEEEKAS